MAGSEHRSTQVVHAGALQPLVASQLAKGRVGGNQRTERLSSGDDVVRRTIPYYVYDYVYNYVYERYLELSRRARVAACLCGAEAGEGGK